MGANDGNGIEVDAHQDTSSAWPVAVKKNVVFASGELDLVDNNPGCGLNLIWDKNAFTSASDLCIE